MIASLLLFLVLAIGVSVWYCKERSTLAFFIAACAWVVFGIVVIACVPVLVLLAVLVGAIYVYSEHLPIIGGVKILVDKMVFGKVEGE